MSEPTESRTSILPGQITLLALFLVIAVVGVLTVLLPELEDDSNEDGPGQRGDDAAEVVPPADEPAE
ncbi:MAG: hypothetical protein AB7S26_19025 [Sandaracinaceae bacterium]